ncbi:MAG: Na+/H+ antiporter subunit E [Phycisphaerales bacterium]
MIFASNILLAILWSLLIGPFSPANLLVGFFLSMIALSLCSNAGRAYAGRFWAIVSLLIFLSTELVKANVKVAYYTISRLDRLRPAVLAVPLEPLTDTELTLLTILITLTPGTLTLDISEDKRQMFVHFMHVDDPQAAIRDIKAGFERRILEATR